MPQETIPLPFPGGVFGDEPKSRKHQYDNNTQPLGPERNNVRPTVPECCARLHNDIKTSLKNDKFGSLALDLWLGIFVFGALALDLWIWIFGLGISAWDLWLGILGLGN